MHVYEFLLNFHSGVRWLVLLVAIVAIGQAYVGWLGKRPWTSLADRLGLIFTITLDVQFLLGLILYFVSPLVQGALSDFGAAMARPELRFFAVEHVALMLLAVVVAHVGRVLAKRAATDTAKYQRSALLYTVSIVLVLLGIPWNRL